MPNEIPKWHRCDCCGQELPDSQKKTLYDQNFGDDKTCICGHLYYRHFDTYEEMRPVGCKYCGCNSFEEEGI